MKTSTRTVILTFNQWQDRGVREVAARYEVTLVEAREYPRPHSEYIAYVIAALDAGLNFAIRHWKSLGARHQDYVLCRSRRLLRDTDELRRLRWAMQE